MNSTITNISVTGACIFGGTPAALEEKQMQTLANALQYSRPNLYGSIGAKMDDVSCGVAYGVALKNGTLTTTAEFFETNSRAASFISMGSDVANDFEAVAVLHGSVSMEHLRRGLLHSVEVRGFWLVKKDGGTAEMADSMVTHMKTTGSAGLQFAKVVEKHIRLGARHPFVAALREAPEEYNKYRAQYGTGSAAKKATVTRLEHKNAPVDVSHITKLASKDRGAAIVKFARTNPAAYNEARKKGLL